MNTRGAGRGVKRRAGDIKPTHLDTREGWGAVFRGEGKDA